MTLPLFSPILPLTCRQATAYGKCIVADYNAVHKDKCAKQFMRLKDCYLVRLFGDSHHNMFLTFLRQLQKNHSLLL